MFGFKKQNSTSNTPGLLGRLRQGLQKTRMSLFGGLTEQLSSKAKIDPDLLEEIETRLLMADLGIESTTKIIQAVTDAMKRRQLNDLGDLLTALRGQMLAQLQPVEQNLDIPTEKPRPFVILMVGVNGVGKTTTIGKLTNHLQQNGKTVLLAAGDTFRAAAIEQIRTWGERTNSPVIAQQTGSDAAAVIYDALQSARAQDKDVVIADTAGRLHTKSNLMEELKKIRRTITKFDPTLPVEVMLVIDAGTGQNALEQARQFHEAVGLTGIALTKLDGTAKGGVLFALAATLSIPIRFIGIGEQLDDLRPFAATDFVDALLDINP